MNLYHQNLMLYLSFILEVPLKSNDLNKNCNIYPANSDRSFLKRKCYGGCCGSMQLGKKCKEMFMVDSTIILQVYDTYICSHSC